jgi:hypothetical protein
MSSLIASAIGCSTPFQPTRFGPLAHLDPADHPALDQLVVEHREQYRHQHHDDHRERAADGVRPGGPTPDRDVVLALWAPAARGLDDGIEPVHATAASTTFSRGNVALARARPSRARRALCARRPAAFRRRASTGSTAPPPWVTRTRSPAASPMGGRSGGIEARSASGAAVGGPLQRHRAARDGIAGVGCRIRRCAAGLGPGQCGWRSSRSGRRGLSRPAAPSLQVGRDGGADLLQRLGVEAGSSRSAPSMRSTFQPGRLSPCGLHRGVERLHAAFHVHERAARLDDGAIGSITCALRSVALR